MPCVSVIVPAYNSALYIHECLDSLVTQTLQDIEIIVINDGSTDDTADIVRTYSEKHPAVHLLEQANAGQAAARNVGVRSSRGKYVVFVDSDDYIERTALEVLYQAALAKDVDIVRGWYRVFDNRTGTVKERNKPRRFSPTGTVLGGSEYLCRAIKCREYEVVPVLNLIRRAYLINNAIFFREHLSYEDVDYTLRMLVGQPCTVMQLDTEFYYYRKHDSNETKNPSLRGARRILECVKSVDEFVSNVSLDPKTLRACLTAVSYGFYAFTSVYGRLQDDSERKALEVCLLPRLKHTACRYGPLKIRFKNILFIYARFLFVVCHKLKRRGYLNS